MQDLPPSNGDEPLLAFGGVLAVVGGGTFDPAILRALADIGAGLVGADGGGDAIAAAGLVPDAIIGDLDSLADPDGWDARTRVIRVAEQVTTDFQKVLRLTTAPVTVALGMTGKRLDHTLAALSAVTEYADARRIILVDEHDIALAVTGAFSFAVAPGDRVSIHPLAPIGFARSEGLVYPLDGLRLAPGGLIGTSNAASGHFSIEPDAASQDVPWLLIVPGRYLFDLIARLRG